jgi:hypothetical protein
MKAGDYVRYVGPGHIEMTNPDLPLEWVSQVEHWVNNFRHKDHNCSTWLFRPIWPEKKPGGSVPMPIERGYHYGIACDYEVVDHNFKQHLVEVEKGLRVAEKLMG